jgi:hypothetical protein
VDKPEEQLQLEQPILRMLARIADGLTAVSTEIQQMRKTLSGNGTISDDQEAMKPSASKDPMFNPIRLDFEAFVKGQNQEGKES